MSMRMNTHIGPLQLHTGPPRSHIAQRVDDGVLQLQSAEMRVSNSGMLAAEIAGKRGARPEMLRPVNLANSVIKPVRIDRIEPGQLEKHTIRHPRPQARAIRNLQGPREGDPGRSLTRVRRA